MNVWETIQNYSGARLNLYKRIFWHHSLTKDGQVADSVGIKNWHTGKIGSSDPKAANYNPYVSSPMMDIGYHFLIELVHNRYEFVIGRSLDLQGAHVKGQNADSIGCCLVGNFDLASPTCVQYHLCASLTRELMRKFSISKENVFAHHDFDVYKSCPGKKFSMSTLQSMLIL